MPKPNVTNKDVKTKTKTTVTKKVAKTKLNVTKQVEMVVKAAGKKFEKFAKMSDEDMERYVTAASAEAKKVLRLETIAHLAHGDKVLDNKYQLIIQEPAKELLNFVFVYIDTVTERVDKKTNEFIIERRWHSPDALATRKIDALDAVSVETLDSLKLTHSRYESRVVRASEIVKDLRSVRVQVKEERNLRVQKVLDAKGVQTLDVVAFGKALLIARGARPIVVPIEKVNPQKLTP
jgi:hypothetical protein